MTQTALATALTAILLIPVASVGALDSGGGISQGFGAKELLQPGTLVSYADDTRTAMVVAANIDNVKNLVGVVDERPLVELSNGGTQTQVVISGTVQAFVSDINGVIRNGDKITASPVNGVGMKLLESTQIVGTAQEDFTAAHQITTQKIKDSTGNEKTVRVGLITIQVGISYNQSTKNEDKFIPLFLQRTADEIAGRSVGPIRILIAGLIFILGIGAGGVLLHSSVGSSIISMGRNPLSAKSIWRSLLEVSAITIAVLLATVIGAYLILAA